MTSSPQPWPKPVRVLVLGTLVVAIGVGLVVALYDKGRHDRATSSPYERGGGQAPVKAPR